MHSDRDMIQTGRESQTKDLPKKTEELTDRVIELPSRKKTAQKAAA